MVLEIGFGHLATMDPGPIPNQDDLACYVSVKMVQRLDQFLAVDRTFKMSFVDLAR